MPTDAFDDDDNLVASTDAVSDHEIAKGTGVFVVTGPDAYFRSFCSSPPKHWMFRT